MSWVGKVAKIGGMVGTIIPAALLIILGIIYLANGGQSNMDFHSSFFPDLPNLDNVVLAASIFLFYTGMEMGGIHVKDVNNPSKKMCIRDRHGSAAQLPTNHSSLITYNSIASYFSPKTSATALYLSLIHI